MTLTAAHKGYEYQDVYSALLILRAFREFEDFEFFVDKKEHKNDQFDDLTIITKKQKIKVQIRHSADQYLSITDLQSNGAFSVEEFSKSYISGEPNTTYILATTRVLRAPDGAFKKVLTKDKLLSPSIWTLKREAFNTVSASFKRNFFIDAGLPKMTNDYVTPGDLENNISEFLKSEIGVGSYPNNDLTADRFVDAFCKLVRSIRVGDIQQPVSKKALINLMQTTGLKVDYGHIAQQFPLVGTEQRLHFKALQKKLADHVLKSSTVILVGLPGSGKSHQFDSLFSDLNKRNDLIATQHYCYLEPTDDLVIERINVDRMFGNIVHQMQERYPLIADKLPRMFAADRLKVEQFAKVIVEQEKKRVIVMVDGLDHLERVVNQRGGLSSAIVNKFIDELSRLKMPKNSTLVISSQPGDHLKRFENRADVAIVEVPPWESGEVRAYLKKEGVSEQALSEKRGDETLLGYLTNLSEGNPLYLNYLTKEIKAANERNEYWSIVQKLPKLDSNINKYYGHLLHTVREDDIAVAETIALLDFSVTPDQLLEMFPGIDKRRVASVLRQLHPVLRDSFAIKGFRIYHESFRRYVLENAAQRNISKRDLYAHIIEWLRRQEFYESGLSYYYLFSYLRRGQQSERIREYITTNFLRDSLYALRSVEAISANIALAADVAAQTKDWEMLTKLVQINKALYTFSEEREYIHEDYIKTHLAVFGPKVFSQRLVVNGKAAFPLVPGFKYCHRIAVMGGDAPWGSYDLRDFSMQVDTEDKKHTFHDLEAGVFFRRIYGKEVKQAFEILEKQIRLHKKISNQRRIDLLVDQLFFVFKAETVLKSFFNAPKVLRENKEAILAFGRYIRSERDSKRLTDLISNKKKRFTGNELSRLAKAKVKVKSLVDKKIVIADLHSSGKRLIETEKSIYEDDLDNFKKWYYLLPIVTAIDYTELEEQKKTIRVDGWYRAWLTFLIDLAIAESTPSVKKREKMVLDALSSLSEHQEPFRGQPRACDLYSIHFLTFDSFSRAVAAIETIPTLKKAVPLLEKISRGTTTTLERSPSGPLTEEDLSEVYAKNLAGRSQEFKTVLRDGVLQQFKAVKDRGRFYEEQADEAMRCARVLMELGESSRAKKLFKEACTYAHGYGMRKDITAWEIIEPISSFYRKDRAYAIAAFEKTYKVPHILRVHTDGKETKWTLNRWYETLFDADLSRGMEFLTEDIKLTHTKRDWRIEFISEDATNRLVGKIDPRLVFRLYQSLEMGDYERTDFEFRFSLLEDLFKRRLPTEEYVHSLSIWLNAWSYHFTDKTPYVQILRKFFALQRRYGFKVDKYFAQSLRKKIKEASTPRFEHLGLHRRPEKKKKVPRIFKGLKDVDSIRVVLETTFSDNLIDSKNIQDYSNIVCEYVKRGEKQLAASLLVTYARKTLVSGPLRAMGEMGARLKSLGQKDLAAEAYSLAFFYSRGSNGWGVMGDEESYSLAQESISLSKKIFRDVLARETAQNIEKPAYFTKGTQHLAEVFCNVSGDVSEAKKIWDAMYEVIDNRLPHPEWSWLRIPQTLSRSGKPMSLSKSAEALLEQRNLIKDSYY